MIREHVEEKSIESPNIHHQYMNYNSYKHDKYSVTWHINLDFVRHMVYCDFFS